MVPSLSGSPNIIMDRKTKEQQDTSIWLPSIRQSIAIWLGSESRLRSHNSSCTNIHNSTGEDLLRSLYAAPAGLLVESTPDSYAMFDTLYDYSVDRTGLGKRVDALLYVDGKSVEMPLLAALGKGLVDVPLLLQSAQAEMDCYPTRALSNIDQQQLVAYFNKSFAGAFGPTMGLQVAGRYREYSAIAPEYAVYALDADTACACGLRALAREAGRGFGSPVYVSTVTGAPGNRSNYGHSSSSSSATGPVSVPPRFAYHNWDFMAASGTWNKVGYCPTVSDEAFGSVIFHDLARLIATGRLHTGGSRNASYGWRDVREAPDWPQHYFAKIVEKTGVQSVVDLKTVICKWWDSVGVNQILWWIGSTRL